MFLQVYADYLLHGGNPKDFMNLTPEDIQIMYLVGHAEKVHTMNTILRAIAKMLGAKEI